MIYVASSWRNEHHGEVVKALRDEGLTVYDFKEPTTCFKWEEVADVQEHGGELTPAEYIKALNHPRARAGFNQDMGHLHQASTVIMILPCGNSAHQELGYAVGRGKACAIYMPTKVTDMDLMHAMVQTFYSKLDRLVAWAFSMEKQAVELALQRMIISRGLLRDEAMD